MNRIERVSVVGAGVMGHGIALAYAMGGYPVTLNDTSEAILDQALKRIQTGLETFAQGGLIPRSSIGDIFSRITATPDLKASVAKADFITEAVFEDVELKRKLYAELDRLCLSHAIIASNTSSLVLRDFSAGFRRKDKILITHWFNPPHIVPVVEVVKGEETSDETLDLTIALLKKIKKLPVKILKEIPGFLVNRIQMAIIREVWSLWTQGIASPEDIDVAVKGSIGLRLACIGPLLTFDLAGLDLVHRVAENLFKVIDRSTLPPQAIKEKVEAGKLGPKTGEGIFKYTQEQWAEVIKKRDREMLTLYRFLYGTDEPRI